MAFVEPRGCGGSELAICKRFAKRYTGGAGQPQEDQAEQGDERSTSRIRKPSAIVIEGELEKATVPHTRPNQR
jgi:hypothetical protein